MTDPGACLPRQMPVGPPYTVPRTGYIVLLSPKIPHGSEVYAFESVERHLCTDLTFFSITQTLLTFSNTYSFLLSISKISTKHIAL